MPKPRTSTTSTGPSSPENPVSLEAHPDQMEEGFGEEELDNVIPTRGYEMLPMVGLGGSAGCIQALQTFFRAMPADANLVFVVILHLSPDFESTLPEIIQKGTKMRVLT